MRLARPHKSQRGQALVFSLITMGIIILVMLSMYSMGQQSIAKSKLQNTADAAAYSAVQAEARDYNFSAYTNRAVIANQVAVAQMVGMTSWARAYDSTYTNPMSFLPKMMTALGGPLAKIFWDTPAKIHKPISSAFKKGMDVIGPGAVKILDGLITVLEKMQMVYHYGTVLTVSQTLGFSPQAIMQTMAGVDIGSWAGFNDDYNIILQNDPTAQLSPAGMVAVGLHLAQWFTFTEKKDPNTMNKDGVTGSTTGANDFRMAQVTIDSLDGWSRDRSTKGGGPGRNMPELFYVTPQPFVIDPTRFIPFQNGAFLMWLWHRGGTELKNIGTAKKTWSAMDATGFTGGFVIWIAVPFPLPIPIFIPFIPMGNGAARAGPSTDLGTMNNFANANYGGVYTNPNTTGSAMIQRGKGAGATMGGAAGMRTYFDVKNTTKDNFEGSSLILEIEKESSSIKSSNSTSSGQFTLTNGTQSNKMRSMSNAQVYFSRPKKLFPRTGDTKIERGSLYSPYWQARLRPNSLAEQIVFLNFHLW